MPKSKRQPNPEPALSLAAADILSFNDAETYGVSITPANDTVGAPYWQVISIRHLPPEENKGRHNVYVDALDEAGQRCREPALRIGWTWEGRRSDEQADPKLLDKPDNEAAGNIDVDKG